MRYLVFYLLNFLIFPLTAEEEVKSKESNKASEEKKEKPVENDEQLMAREVVGVYVHILPFQIPVIQKGKNRSNFMIEMTIEAQDPEKAKTIYKLRPKIIDTILIDLYSVFGVIWHPGFHVNLTELKERLFKKCQRVLGQHMIKDILIQKFASQRESNNDP